MNSIKNLAALLAVAGMFENDVNRLDGDSNPRVNVNNVTGELPTPPIPNGCKKYYYDDGFSCIASSQKSANKKHLKFKNNEQHN